jgi:hypothetical protein
MIGMDTSSAHWDDGLLADQMFVALIIWVDANCWCSPMIVSGRVVATGRNPSLPLDHVLEEEKLAFFFRVLYLQVTNGRLEHGSPINHVLATGRQVPFRATEQMLLKQPYSDRHPW